MQKRMWILVNPLRLCYNRHAFFSTYITKEWWAQGTVRKNKHTKHQEVIAEVVAALPRIVTISSDRKKVQ